MQVFFADGYVFGARDAEVAELGLQLGCAVDELLVHTLRILAFFVAAASFVSVKR